MKQPKTLPIKSAAPLAVGLRRLVRRMAMGAELAWNNIGGIAADLNVAVCGGTYAQHAEVMEQQFEREDAIRKKYAPNVGLVTRRWASNFRPNYWANRARKRPPVKICKMDGTRSTQKAAAHSSIRQTTCRRWVCSRNPACCSIRNSTSASSSWKN